MEEYIQKIGSRVHTLTYISIYPQYDSNKLPWFTTGLDVSFLPICVDYSNLKNIDYIHDESDVIFRMMYTCGPGSKRTLFDFTLSGWLSTNWCPRICSPKQDQHMAYWINCVYPSHPSLHISQEIYLKHGHSKIVNHRLKRINKTIYEWQQSMF